jgi:pimeloyl-ACP methyl ester carboxylesterase
MEDLRDDLRGFPKPVLVLSGAQDRTTATASAHELAELLPNADEVVIPDAAHVALYEQPEATLGALRRFLAGV